MKVKLLILVSAFLLVGIAPSFAQVDQGAPDSLIMLTNRPEAGGNETDFQVELYLVNDVDVYTGMAVGFSWVNDNLTLDSAKFVEHTWTLAPFLFDGSIANANATKNFMYSGAEIFATSGIQPSAVRKHLATWYFTLSSWGAMDEIVIDTNEFIDGASYEMISNPGSGDIIIPTIWVHGDAPIIVRDPSDADDEDDLVPATYSLSQNYPNPFNPTTIIEFGLASSVEYELTIYNVVGQVVKTFKDIGTAGNNEIEWDASEYGSGVYFYKLTAGSFNETKKMVLVK